MISRVCIKDFLVYSLGSIVTQLSNIGLMLFLMYQLPPDQVGLFSLSLSATLVLSTVVSFGLRQLFMIEFFTLTSTQRKELANDCIILYVGLSMAFFVASFFGFNLVNKLLFAGHASSILLCCVIALSFFTFFTEFFYQALMYTLKSMHVTLIRSFLALFIVGVSVIILYFFNVGAVGVIAVQVVGYIMLVVYACSIYYQKGLWRYLNVRRTWQKSCVILQKSVPLVPTVLAGLLLASGNRWVLARYASLADIAVYAIAEYVAPIFNLLILYPLSGAYVPRIMNALNEGDTLRIESHNKKLMWLSMTALCILGGMSYVVLKTAAQYFLPAHYCTAIPGAFAVFCGQILLMGTYFTSSIILYKKKTIYMLTSIALAAVTNMVFSIALVPYYGINGCFIGYVAAYALYFGLVYWGNRVVVRACVTHAQDRQGTQKAPAYQAAVLLQQEDQVPSNNKKESSSGLEDRSF